MGLNTSVFTREELQEYADMTYFSYGDILRLYKKFDALNKNSAKPTREVRITSNAVSQLPELKYNPFSPRLCSIFSTATDGSDGLTFDDFMDMMNALSDSASFQLKSTYAFRLFDMNNDGFIDEEDIISIVKLLTENDTGLQDELLMKELCDAVIAEADLDDDKQLSLAEFEHVLSKSPDFMNSFKIRI